MRFRRFCSGGSSAPLRLLKLRARWLRPMQMSSAACGVHERIMELLTSVGTPKVHLSVTPRKIVDRVKLGESLGEGEAARVSLKASGVRDAFYSFIEPPLLTHVS